MANRRKSVADKQVNSKSIHLRLALALIAIVAFFSAMGIDYLLNMNKFYPGVKINNIDVSGMTKEQANDTLRSSLEDTLNSKVLYIFTDEESYNNINVEDYLNQQDLIAEQISALQAQDNTKVFTTSASSVGASYDYASAIDRAFIVGKSASPIERIMTRIFGSNSDISLVLGDGADELYSSVSSTTGEKHVDYNVSVVDGYASVTEGKAGSQINRSNFTQTIATTLKESNNPTSKLLFRAEYDPVLIDESKAQALADTINSTIKDGASFSFRDEKIDVDTNTLGSWISTEISGDTPDTSQIKGVINSSVAIPQLSTILLDNLETTNVSVTMTKDESNILIHPNEDVIVPKLDDAILDLQTHLFNTESQEKATIAISESDQKDNFDLQTAIYSGLVRKIASYTTTYTSSYSTINRNHNIHLVSDYITNTIIPASGGTFSFSDAAGPCTANEGFLEASAISSDEVVQEVAGGICQVATTVFNAAYDAGLPIVERYPHSLRMTSYPDGRDAAVYVPDVDLKFQNDSASDLLLTATYTDTSVTVSLYGSMEEREVVSETSAYEVGKKYTTKYVENSSLASGSWSVKTVGVDGSKITVERKVYNASGTLLYDNYITSTYSPVNEVIQYGSGTDLSELKKSRESTS